MNEIHTPAWAKKGCIIISVWDEVVISGNSKGIKTKVKFLNKKKEEITMTKWVKWSGITESQNEVLA